MTAAQRVVHHLSYALTQRRIYKGNFTTAAVVSVVANEDAVDHRALNDGGSPLRDLLAPRFQR